MFDTTLAITQRTLRNMTSNEVTCVACDSDGEYSATEFDEVDVSTLVSTSRDAHLSKLRNSRYYRNKRVVQYHVADNEISSIWYRVLFYNDRGLQEDEDNFLGKGGHLEKANALTHLFASVVYVLYAIVRPVTPCGQINTPASHFVYVVLLSYIFAFSSSVVYHVYSANRLYGAYARLLDYGAIYVSMTIQLIGDVLLLSTEFRAYMWQHFLDVTLTAAILVTFFVVRRLYTPIKDTLRMYYLEQCSVGFARL